MSSSPSSGAMRGSKGSGGGGQEILVNGEDRVIPDECTVAQLLESIELGVLSGRKVAVALNRNVVPRSNYARTTLAPGDHVEILEAVGGG